MRDRLFWIPVTVAVVFDDYTILHLKDCPDCAMDLYSLQHLAVDFPNFKLKFEMNRYDFRFAAFRPFAMRV